MRSFAIVGVMLFLCCGFLAAAEPKGEWTVRRIDTLETKVASLEDKLNRVLEKLESNQKPPVPATVPASVPAKAKTVLISGVFYNQQPDGSLTYCTECNQGSCPAGTCGNPSLGGCPSGTCQASAYYQPAPSFAPQACQTSAGGGCSLFGRFGNACGSSSGRRGLRGLFGCQ